jgi:diguanylate cyclase (GGDEF)-like protein
MDGDSEIRSTLSSGYPEDISERLLAALLVIQEGVQFWSAEGRAIFVNPATVRQFGPELGETGVHYNVLVRSCLDEAGKPFFRHEFPVARALENGRPTLGVLVQTSGPATPRKWLRVTADPLIDADTGTLIGALSATVDVTEFVNQGQRWEYQAHYDSLTGLPNRVLLFDRIHRALARSQRNGELLAVCLMDLDSFKPINDNLGHAAGDRFLQEIGRRLRAVIRADDTVARIGGDEFVLLMEELKYPGQCEHALKRVLDTVAQPFSVDGKEVGVSASIGVSLFPGDVADPDQMLRHADQAMYKAKDTGKNRYHLFDPVVESRLRANRGVISQIGKAIDASELRLMFQPKVDCRRGEVVGMEALLRWDHPVLGTRLPREFLPLIDQDEVAIRLGEWVIAEALRHRLAWQAQGFDLPVSVNVSARGLLRGNTDSRLEQWLRRCPPEQVRRLEIEIAENGVLEDVYAAGALVSRLQALGVEFALDDFGTGDSSLLRLNRLGANTLKIDQSFIHDMLDDPGSLAIVRAVIGMAGALRHQVVAEGVESIEQILMLLKLGCHVMQGYAIARPMAPQRVPAWIKSFQVDPRWHAAHLNYPSRSDFELLLMEVSHRHWFKQLREALARGTAPRKLPHVSYDDCRLARWYAGAGMKRFGSSPEFLAVDAAHHDMHRCAEQMVERIGAGDPVTAHEPEAALTGAYENLMARLHEFRLSLTGSEQ